MRVLHVISSGGMYGAEAVILSLSRELNGSGEHTSSLGVFASPNGPAPALHAAAIETGMPTHLVRCDAQLDRCVPQRLRELAASTGAEVVHAHGYKADVYSFIAFRVGGPALVSTCHTWYDNDLALRAYGVLDRYVLRRFAGVLAVSPEVEERLLAAGVESKRVRVIRNGVALEAFACGPQARAQRRAYGAPLRVGLVGRFAPEKGIDVFLHAVARVKASFPEAQFAVAGDGPDRPSLEALRSQLNLAKTVAMPGEERDMAGFYASLDLLVSASRQEGLPVALLEGMASGLPVVATRVGAVPQVVADGVTGLLVEPENSGALAEAMNRMLDSPGLRESFGRAGQALVRETFSAARMTEDYLALYQQVLETRAAGLPARARA